MGFPSYFYTLKRPLLFGLKSDLHHLNGSHADFRVCVSSPGLEKNDGVLMLGSTNHRELLIFASAYLPP